MASALLLAGPTALAAWLVFPGLGRAPLWRDEVATVSVAGRDLLGTMRVLWHREANMGLYYLVMNGWLRAGGGEIWVRLPSAVFAVATVPVTMLLARRAFGARAALAAGTVLASNSFLLTYAREARSYSLVALLAATSTLLLIRALDQPSRWRWICYVAASAAMVYSHMLAALVVVAQMASLPAARRGRGPWRTVLRSLFALAVLVLPLTAYAVLRDTGQTSWVPRPTPATLWRLGISYAGSPLLLLLEAALAALAVGGAARTALTRGRCRLVWLHRLALLWLLLLPAVVYLVSQRKPLLVDRYLIAILPALAVVVAAGVRALRRTVLMAAAAALLVVASYANVRADAGRRSKPEDLRAAARLVLDHQRPGDGVAYAPAFARPGFDYYLSRLAGPRHGKPADLALRPGGTAERVGDVFPREDTPPVVARRLLEYSHVWLVGYPGNPWHPTPEPVLALEDPVVRRSFVPLGTWSFGQIRITLLQRRWPAGRSPAGAEAARPRTVAVARHAPRPARAADQAGSRHRSEDPPDVPQVPDPVR